MLDVIHADDQCVAINKPSGVSLLRDRSGAPNLYDEIRREYPEVKLIHRLDKGTSGVLLLARNDEFHSFASRCFSQRKVTKFYVAITAGHLPQGRTLTIDLPLKPGRKSRFRIAGLREEIRSHPDGWRIDSDDGYKSITRFRVLKKGKRRSLLVLQPISGRTHQIRVHLSWIGHAIAGDLLYGSPQSQEQSWDRLLLHSARIRLPGSYDFESDVPEEFNLALDS